MLGGQVLACIGVGVILTDGNGCIQWANSRQQWFTGLTPALLLGASLQDHGWFSVSGVERAVQLVLAKRATQQLFWQQQRMSCRIEVMPLFVQGRCLGAAILLYNTHVVSAVDRRADEPQLSEQHALLQLFRELLDHLPFGVAVLDQDHTVLYANAVLAAQNKRALTGLSWREAFPAGVQAQIARGLAACREAGSPLCIDAGREDSGRLITISSMETHDGLTLFVVTDAASAAGASDFEAPAFIHRLTNLSHFAARVVHDVRNQLNVLLCQLDLLRRENLYEPGGVHKFQGAIDLFYAHIGKIEHFLQEIEPLGSQAPSRRSPAALDDVLCQAVSVAMMNRPSPQYHIESELPAGFPDYPCDSLRLQKVISGLLQYAMEELNEPGSVALTLGYHEAAGFNIRIVYSGATAGLVPSVHDEQLWRRANIRLALAAAIVQELHGTIKMRHCQGGKVEIRLVFPPVHE